MSKILTKNNAVIASTDLEVGYCVDMPMQEKVVVPSFDPQTVISDNGYIALSKVTVTGDNPENVSIDGDKVSREMNMVTTKIPIYKNNIESSFTRDIDIPYDFYLGAAVVYNNEIHILGGYEYETRHYKFDGEKWVEVSEIPNYFEYCPAVVYQNKIHIFGVYDSDEGDEVAHYEWDGDAWTKLSNMPYDFQYGSAVVYNDEIHIIGGDDYYEGHYKWLGESNDTWEEIDEIPSGFYRAPVVSYGGYIHVLGGYNDPDDGYYSAHYTWSSSSGWEKIGTTPFQTENSVAVVYNNKIHLMCGEYSYDGHFSFDGTSWSREENYPICEYESSAVVYNNEIHVVGGYYGYERYHYRYKNGEKYVICETIFEALSDSPIKSSGGCSVVAGNKIHLLGGYNYDYTTKEENYLNTHYVWDGSTETWSQEEEIPYAFYRGTAVELNGEIHVMGGYYYDSVEGEEYYCDEHYKYDGSTWTPLEDIPLSVRSPASVVFNGEIHLFGGYDGSDASDTHYVYDEVNDSWDESDPLPVPLYLHSAVVFNGEIHIIGGYNNSGANNMHIKYNSSGEWEFLDDMNFSPYGSVATVFDNEIYIIGGDNFDNEDVNVYRYKNNKWIPCGRLPSNYSRSSGVTYNSEIHIFGGKIGSEYSNKHYVYGVQDAFVEI